MPGAVMPPTKVFVGRLTADVKSADLRKLFERYGEVTECDILGTYGFVHMKTPDQADEVIQKLHGHEVHGSRITVEHSTGVRGRGGGRGGRGGGGMRGMRGGMGGAVGGYRNSRPAVGVSDRFSPYGRPAAVGYPAMMDRSGYAAYPAEYGMDRRAMPMRSAESVGYYDDYERRDPYAARAVGVMPRGSYDAAVAAAYDRRPPPMRDPYGMAPAAAGVGGAGAAGAVMTGAGGLYDRRDEYADMYARRSPPRYQAEAAMSAGAAARPGYESYDRYAAAASHGVSPTRRYPPQHRELTAVRRY